MDTVPQRLVFDECFDRLSSELKLKGEIETISNLFAKLTSDYERFAFVMDMNNIDSIFDVSKIPKTGKSSLTSERLRNEGNKWFKNGQYNEALLLYSESLAFALDYREDDSEKNNLALAFSNRSAALYYLKAYLVCMVDIDSALKSGYPENMQYKLYDRKGKCLRALKNNNNAKEAFEAAKALLNKADVDKKKKNTLLKEFDKNIEECEKTVSYEDVPSFDVASSKVVPTVASGSHTVFTSLSSACKVDFTPKQGRFIVADRDILPGEVILVEKPYASVLLPDQYKTHCHHCMACCLAPLPCPQCSTARYCSPTCREQSWVAYHRHECAAFDIIHQSGVGKFGYLALRTATIAGLSRLLDQHAKSSQNNDTAEKMGEGFDSDDCYTSSSYNAIFHLVTHDVDRAVHDLFRRTVMAFFLTQCLARTGFFDDVTMERRTAVIAVGALLLRHLQLLPCNAHEIAELELEAESVATSLPKEIGAGIYSTLSLFNHSCDPTVNRNFYGDTCVVRAIKMIRRGQEVSDNYGAVFAVHSRDERRSKLKSQYYFECTCQACVQNWPLYPDIPYELVTFCCRQCGQPFPDTHEKEIVCSGCSFKENILDKQAALQSNTEAYQVAFEELLKGDVKGALPKLLSFIKMVDESVVLPWREYNNCQEAVKQCYSMMGNCCPAKPR